MSLSACGIPHWWAEMGDPTLWGWAMTLACGLAALAAAGRWRSLRDPGSDMRGRSFWAALAVIVGLVAINTQADLQTLLIGIGRCLAHAGGWFELRREVQATFFVVLTVAVVAGLVLLAVARRGAGRGAALALAGLAAMAIFVTWRAAEFLHVESEFLHALSHMHVPRLFEAGGPIAVILGARKGRTAA